MKSLSMSSMEMLEDEITAENWQKHAVETLKQYYNRGGPGKGNEPQLLLDDANFINHVGYSLSIIPNVDPTNFSDLQLVEAYEGNLSYYEEKSLEPIRKIINKIVQEANGDPENFVTILPISLFYKECFYTFPLYRFKQNKNDADKFIDNIGRVYTSFDDWLLNNRLPNCEIIYPKDGQLTVDENGEVEYVCEISAEANRPVKTLLACDILSGTIGVGATIAATIATGGAALVFMGAAGLTTMYGAGRSVSKLRDRANHSETLNPFADREAFWIWLGLGSDVLTFGAIGVASAKVLSTISSGTKIAEFSRKSFTTAGKVLSVLTGSAKPISEKAHILVGGYELFLKIRTKNELTEFPLSLLLRINNCWKEFDDVNMLMMCVTAGFWHKEKMSYCQAEQFTREIEFTTVQQFSRHLDSSAIQHLFFYVQRTINNDQLFIDCFRHLPEVVLPSEFVVIMNDVFVANDQKHDIEIEPRESTILLGTHHLEMETLNQLTSLQRLKIVGFLKDLDISEENNFTSIREFISSDLEMFRILANNDCHKILQIFYDIFVICFGSLGTEVQLIIDSEANELMIKEQKFSIDLLTKLSETERRMTIFTIKKMNGQELKNFAEWRMFTENDMELLKIISKAERTQQVLEILADIFDANKKILKIEVLADDGFILLGNLKLQFKMLEDFSSVERRTLIDILKSTDQEIFQEIREFLNDDFTFFKSVVSTSVGQAAWIELLKNVLLANSIKWPMKVNEAGDLILLGEISIPASIFAEFNQQETLKMVTIFVTLDVTKFSTMRDFVNEDEALFKGMAESETSNNFLNILIDFHEVNNNSFSLKIISNKDILFGPFEIHLEDIKQLSSSQRKEIAEFLINLKDGTQKFLEIKEFIQSDKILFEKLAGPFSKTLMELLTDFYEANEKALKIRLGENKIILGRHSFELSLFLKFGTSQRRKLVLNLKDLTKQEGETFENARNLIQKDQNFLKALVIEDVVAELNADERPEKNVIKMLVIIVDKLKNCTFAFSDDRLKITGEELEGNILTLFNEMSN